MNDHAEVTVPLSSTTTSITLPWDPGRALGHFLANGRRWISWSELQDVGVSDPDTAVRQLEELGASFQRMYKDMATSSWELHEDAPHYKYLGMRLQAPHISHRST